MPLRTNATLRVGGVPVRAALHELSSPTTRQLADRGRVGTRLYTGRLDRDLACGAGPLWVDPDGGRRFVAYPLCQTRRDVRLARRDGEFAPGLALERLGPVERDAPQLVAAGEGWYLVDDGLAAFRTDDFLRWEHVPALRGQALGCVLPVGAEVVVGAVEHLWTSDDGRAWTGVALPAGLGEVLALAFDGHTLRAACRYGLAAVDWTTRTATALSSEPHSGLSDAFGGEAPYRARPVAEGTAIDDPNGAPWRLVPDAWTPAANFVRRGDDAFGPRFLRVGGDGTLWSFGRADARRLGRVRRADRAAWAPTLFALRRLAVGVGWGRLYWSDGQSVALAHDFGADAAAFAAAGGFVVAAADGMLYRVRRIAAPS